MSLVSVSEAKFIYVQAVLELVLDKMQIYVRDKR